MQGESSQSTWPLYFSLFSSFIISNSCHWLEIQFLCLFNKLPQGFRIKCHSSRRLSFFPREKSTLKRCGWSSLWRIWICLVFRRVWLMAKLRRMYWKYLDYKYPPSISLRSNASVVLMWGGITICRRKKMQRCRSVRQRKRKLSARRWSIFRWSKITALKKNNWLLRTVLNLHYYRAALAVQEWRYVMILRLQISANEGNLNTRNEDAILFFRSVQLADGDVTFDRDSPIHKYACPFIIG